MTILPNGVIGFRFADGHEENEDAYESSGVRIAADRARSMRPLLKRASEPTWVACKRFSLLTAPFCLGVILPRILERFPSNLNRKYPAGLRPLGLFPIKMVQIGRKAH